MPGGTDSGKGWVVIPKEIRDKYRLAKGSRVRIVDHGDTIGIVPSALDAIADARGMPRGTSKLTGALLKERAAEKRKEGVPRSRDRQSRRG